MKNFIKDIDTFYNEELLRNKIPKDNKKFTVFLSLNFKYGKNNNKNFIVRKNDFTKYLFVKNDVRVYFSDADILNMLLQIDDRNIMDDLLLGLKNLFNGKGEEYIIFVNDVEYKGLGIPYIGCTQIFSNPQDIEIEFDDLFVLINLILAKDIASTPLWNIQFVKRTIGKYLILLKWYYYKDKAAGEYLHRKGYFEKNTIYENFNTNEKREANNLIFNDIKEFEKLSVL